MTLDSEVNITKHLSKLGLKQDEIDGLTPKDAIQYIRFFHRKNWGISSVLFIGFSDAEMSSLSSKAEHCKLSVKNRLSNQLSFICVSEKIEKKRLVKVLSYDAMIITKMEFILIFNEEKYNLLNSKLLYNSLVPEEFRIAKPLSDFDGDVPVESFAYDNENTYMVNLHLMNCTCKDFEKKQRHQYLKGDIRRLCKHLMDVYKNSFGLAGLSKLNTFIIENGHPVNKNFKYFNIEKTPYPVVVNYESKSDAWWNVFMANEKGLYSRYGYAPSERRFSYDDKPLGVVSILRKKLDELDRGLSAKTTDIVTPQIITEATGKGYGYFILLLIFALFLYIIFR